MTPDEPAAEDLFARALDLPPEQRGAFLAQGCGSDSQLREEVESLLRWHELADAEGFEIPEEPDSATSPALAHIRARTLKQLDRFELQQFLGEGATGIVYRARDTRTGESVAIKIASPKTILSPSNRDRFVRAAEAASKIQHSGIARILETGSFEGLSYVVLEYVDGKTLSEMLKPGSLDQAAAARIALQIVSALADAHRHGIIHRDLKPANIMLDRAGDVKILDFGLCHAVAGGESIGQTDTGIALGTLGYMAPEQARGEAPTPRSDFFSFGAVLYEMLTGRSAFDGKTSVAILTGVLHHDPEGGEVNSRLMDLALWCLEKNPAKRPASAERILAELQQIEKGSASISLRIRRLPVTPWKVLACAVLLAALVVVSRIFLAPHRLQPDTNNWVQLTRFPDSVSQPSLSPDGRKLAFIRGPSTWADAGQIYLRELPNGEAIQLTNDETRKMSPMFSIDGSEIAYSTVQRNVWDTWLVPSGGGNPRRWLSNAACPIWLSPQRLMFSEILDQDVHMAIVTSDATRDHFAKVYVPENARAMAHRSYPSPDGKWVLVVEMDAASRMLPCRLVPMDGSSPGHPVGPLDGGCTVAAWSVDGKWMVFSTAVRGAFHTWRQRLPNGQPEQVTSGPTEEEGIAMAPDGRSFITAVGLRESSLWLRDSSGERQVSGDGFGFDPKFTRDGKWLCYRTLKGSNSFSNPSELLVREIATGITRSILPGFSLVGGPGFVYDVSPDGTRVVASVSVDGKPRFVLASLDGHDAPRLMPDVEGTNPLFESNDSILLHAGASPGYLFRVALDSSGLHRIGNEPTLPRGSLSPDGRWLPLRITRQGGYFNVLFALDGHSQIELAAPGALDYSLRWAPDGKRVAFSVTTGQFQEHGETYALSLPKGVMLPAIPGGGFRSESELAALPGATRIESWDVAIGPGRLESFSRETLIRNLFRIPFPQ